MKNLLRFVLISAIGAMSLTSCNNADTPQSVNQEVNSNSKTNLQARGEGQEIKDPSNLTPEEQREFITVAIEAIQYFQKNPDATEYTSRAGAGIKAITLCHTPYNSGYGHACVYNSSGYLVNVSWEPKMIDHGNTSGVYPDTTVYSGQIVSQCSC